MRSKNRRGRSARDRRRRRSRLNEAAAWLLRDSKRLIKKHGKRLDEATLALLRQLRGDLELACELPAAKRDLDRLDDAAGALDDALDRHLGRFRKSPLREYVEAIGWAVVLALLIRSFVFEAFKIPTGSMIPTLHVHDHLFVNKFIYGIKIPFTRIKLLDFRQPRRGEVVVFEYPYDDDPESAGKDLIKRVVATPGDLVAMRDNRLIINGRPIERTLLAPKGTCGEAVGAIATCSTAPGKWCLYAPTGDGGEEREVGVHFASPAKAEAFLQARQGYYCDRYIECLGGIRYVAQTRVTGSTADLIMWLGPLNDPTWPPETLDSQRFGPHASRYAKANNPDYPAFRIPEGHLLVMGDNRDNSKDGRYFGLVPMSVVKGKAGILWYAYKRDFWRPDFDRIGRFIHRETVDGKCRPGPLQRGPSE